MSWRSFVVFNFSLYLVLCVSIQPFDISSSLKRVFFNHACLFSSLSFFLRNKKINHKIIFQARFDGKEPWETSWIQRWKKITGCSDFLLFEMVVKVSHDVVSFSFIFSKCFLIFICLLFFFFLKKRNNMVNWNKNKKKFASY